jgi:hypothetical protein
MSSFEARNLRVQLPCGPVTIIDCGAGFTRICRWGTQITCLWGTYCHWGSPCHFGTPCQFGTPCHFGTCGGCSVFTPLHCQFGSPDPCGPGSPIQNITEQLCAGSEDLAVRITVAPEELGQLREALETQLKEISAAEEALKRHTEGKEAE